jgi:MOSC domain-containing protein YiiM
VRECELPEVEAPISARTLTACVAAIAEVPSAEVPCAATEDAWAPIAPWLATRNLAPVPVREPERFQWGGWWIARLRLDDGSAADEHVVMAGTPSGVVWAPAGTGAPEGAAVAEGWVLAPPALALAVDPARTRGVVEALFRFAAPGAPPSPLGEAVVRTGTGVVGDRYADGTGHFSAPGRSGQALTLIEAEALEQLEAEHGVGLAPGAHRRNVVTRGIDLNALRGLRFRVGAVECYAQRLAEPCAWLQQWTPPGTLRGLVHRGGLRADVLTDGVVRPGDRVEPC